VISQENTVQSQLKAASPESLLEGKVRNAFQVDPHRAYSAESLMQALKLASPKDPVKQAAVLAQVQSCFSVLSKEGLTREVAPSVFKTRLFFDEEHNIEHAYIGGMGNTRYAFDAPIFRLNIGVLSLFFFKNEKANWWRVCVNDATIGKNYCLFQFLAEGRHVFGTSPEKGEAKSAWSIEGKYIEKTHVTVILSPTRVDVSDHRTLRGTRIDHLTESGVSHYLDVAEQFLRSTSQADWGNAIKRGRFVLEQLIHHHKNFETSFFNVALDCLLLKQSN
jgi:hypothetical protein